MTDSKESARLAYRHLLRLTGRLTLMAIAIFMMMFLALFYAPYIFGSYTWIIPVVGIIAWVIVAIVGYIGFFKMLPLTRQNRSRK